MYEIDRTVIMKRPATVVDARPVQTLTAPYHRKADLADEVTRLARRGEVRPLTARPSYNENTGQWEQQVVRIRPPDPAWIRPVLILGGVLIGLALLAGLLWWVLASLAAAPFALFLLAVLVALVVIARAGRRPTVTVVQKVNVR